MDSEIAEGVRLFNSQKFFEAHEALEAVWLKSQGGKRTFLHGLIQIAAAFHHFQCGNSEGFRRVFEKGARKLIAYKGSCEGIDISELKRQLAPWSEVRHSRIQADPSERPTLPIIHTQDDREFV